VPSTLLPPGTTFVFTIPLINGAFGGIQRLIALKGTGTVYGVCMGREGWIEIIALRRTKVLDVSQVGGKGILELQLV